MKAKYFIIIALVSGLIFSGCTKQLYKRADFRYSELSYAKAAEYYEKALKKKEFPEAYVKLARCYYNISQYDKSEYWFSIAAHKELVQPPDKLVYAQVLQINKKFDEASTWYSSYLEDFPNDAMAKRLKYSNDNYKKLEADSVTITIQPVSQTGMGISEFGPSYYKDGIVFASDRGFLSGQKTYEGTGKPFLDLYYAPINPDGGMGNPDFIQGKINTIYHESNATFNKEQNIMYFTRNNYYRRKLEKGKEGFNHLEIFSAEFDEKKWKNVKAFPFNSDDFSTGHPSLTEDGKFMYFISDRPGGFGETDIYMTELINNEWSEPRNLGARINSAGKEMFPQICVVSDTLTLFFASNDWRSLGGFDIFYSKYIDEQWTEPINAGFPFNTTKDDFGLITNKDFTQGYFSSNRDDNNIGVDKIYRWEWRWPIFKLNGLVVDKETQKPIEFATVEITYKNEQLTILTANTSGRFTFDMNANSRYKILAMKENYLKNSKEISIGPKKYSETYDVVIELEKMILFKPVKIENIYYDFDKWNIRPDAAKELDRLVKIMKDNPEIIVELGSHTDSRGSDKYNFELSQKRAQSAVDYIMSKGIETNRITAKGYGESQLLNNCDDNHTCDEVQHQFNRRTEFMIVGLMGPDGKPISVESQKGELMYHTVQPGQTASSIAKQYNMTVEELLKLNKTKSQAIKAGDKLLIRNY